MPKIRDISGKKLIKIFEDFDFIIVSQRGSHIKMVRIISNKNQVLVIPNHSSIDKGTLSNIYKQALNFIDKNKLKNIFFT